MSQRVKKPGRPAADDSQGKGRRRRRLSGSDADDTAGGGGGASTSVAAAVAAAAGGSTASTSSSGGSGGGGGAEKPGPSNNNNSSSASASASAAAAAGSSGNGNGLTGMWTPRHLNDLKVSSIYNRNSAEAPAELYRKDLISAMKLPDSEPLTPEEYWLITDSWKQEWEKGVQVPVNPESLPEPEVKLIQPVAERSHDFRLPKKKYVRVTHDDFFNPDYHQLVSTAARAEKVCSYDLDDVDAAWLGCSNADRAMQNTTLISEFLMEQVIEELELQCWEQVQTILKSQEGLGIEYDENVICDVCRSPESEEGNEMVFCDSCNICVHQACYGITTIPSGSWLCRTCTLGIKPTCVLCPNLGGAMKATRSGHTWAHVACAIWIPEVSIGSVERMEPITKISSIPQSRWSLVCVLCKEKTGACIQCSVKTCKTAYHVTCAFKNGLEMKPIIVDENAEDGIKLRSYCQKHSVNTKKKTESSTVEKKESGEKDEKEKEAQEEAKKKVKAMTAEERNQARAEKLQQIESEFYKYVRLKDVSQNLAVDMDVVILIYNYWKLKRKSLNNRPLVPPRPETTQLLTQQQEQDLEQMKMFVQLRQDLERVRNLCYMVSRREKLSRSFFRLKEQTFQKQLALLTETDELTAEERQAVLSANSGTSIYDQFYAHTNTAAAAATSSKAALPDYESLINIIAGGLEAKKETLMNGLIKATGSGTANKRMSKAAAAAAAKAEAEGKPAKAGTSGDVALDKNGNPLKKQFVNGARRKNLLAESSESEIEKKKGRGAAAKTKATPSPTAKGRKGKAAAAAAATTASPEEKKAGKGAKKKPLSYLFDSDSSAENATAPTTAKKGKNAAAGKQVAAAAAAAQAKGKGKVPPGKGPAKTGPVKTSYLSDSDELELPATRATGAKNKVTGKSIYSDSEEETKPLVTPKKEPGKRKESAKAAAKKKQESPELRTPGTPSPRKGKGKAGTPAPAAAAAATTPKGKGKAGGRKGKKAAGFDPTELIVPQREAAKKATESIRSVKQKGGKEAPSQKDEEAVVKEEVAPEKEKVAEKGGKKSAAPPPPKVSTLSDDSDDDMPTYVVPVYPQSANALRRPIARPKSPEVRKTGKKGPPAPPPAAAAVEAQEDEDDDDDKDEFDFDPSKDAKNVSYVPQRQAAKKAAEHIRSGLSNIVAARLIIEDEMEATRKKQKTGDKKDDLETESQESKKESLVEAVAAQRKGTAKERAAATAPLPPPGGKGMGRGGKGRREESAAVPGGKGAARGGRDATDWPFLDKGSQSACRRSRERSSSSGSSSGSSSSSSSSSSSGSSCSSSRSSSASSSRSSSADSASPEPRTPPSAGVAIKGKAPPAAVLVANSAAAAAKLCADVAAAAAAAASATPSSGPGRKLKTSERVPPPPTAPAAGDSRPQLKNPRNAGAVRGEAPPREKPAPKAGRSQKSGSRGGADPFRSAFSPSPEPEPRAAAKGGESSANHDKVSAASAKAAHEGKQRGGPGKGRGRSPAQALPPTPEKKGGRGRKGEPPSPAATPTPPSLPVRGRSGKQAEKDSDAEETATSALPQRTPSPLKSAPEKRSPAKALGPTRGRSPAKATVSGPQLSSESESELSSTPTTRNRKNSSQPAAESPREPRQRRSLEKSGGVLGLSDSDESGAEEKENAQRRESSPALSNKSKGAAPRGGSTPALPPTQSSILSPLTPTENKDKELSRLSDTEQPDAKRPRLDSAGSAGPAGAQVPSTSGGNIKSIFSPSGASTGTGREHDIGLDFDTELYDLAKSVVTEGDEEDVGGNALSFSFPPHIFGQQDTKEDSTLATLNLVEKLRLQHQQHKVTHRPSTDSMSESGQCDNLQDESKSSPSSSRPGSSLHQHQDDSRHQYPHNRRASPSPQREPLAKEGDGKPTRAFSAISTLKAQGELLHGTGLPSPDRTNKQSIQGDERWVPPSHAGGQPPSNTVGTPQPSPRISIPDKSPPLSQQQQQQQQHNRASEELASSGEKNKAVQPPLASPGSAYHALAGPPSSRGTDKGSNLSLDSLPSPPTPVVPSPMVSPLIARQQQQQAGGLPPPPYPGNAAALAAAMAAAEASPNNLAAQVAAAAGLPFGANPLFFNPAFANSPAFAALVAAGVASGTSPLAPFLQVPPGPGVKPGPGSPVGYPPFIPPSVMQQQMPATSSVSTPAPSPGGSTASSASLPPRRPSDVSPLVSVATSMPPLAKPPLTSPSVLLASASNCKSMMSLPPFQSAAAQLIESVVNNHQSSQAASSNLPKTTLSLDTMQPPPQQPTPNPTPSTNLKAPLSSPKLPEESKPQMDSILSPAPSAKSDSIPVATVAPLPPPPPVTPGAGRGRRASTPRAAKQAPEKLTGVNAVIEDMMRDMGAAPPPPTPPAKGKPGRKGASPGRGRPPSTPAKRGGGSGGRGRGKKNLVGVRKDLAGTVYDIDFDEFEESTPDKIDLRSLRERRKSSEVSHTPTPPSNSSPLVLTLPVPAGGFKQSKEEKRAAREKAKEAREQAKREKQAEKQRLKAQAALQKEMDKKEKELAKEIEKQKEREKPQPTVAPLKINLSETIRQQAQEQKEKEKLEKEEATPASKKAQALLQAPLPGPVDMRTYSLTTSTVTTGTTSGGTVTAAVAEESSVLVTGKIAFPEVSKDPAKEIAGLFGLPSPTESPRGKVIAAALPQVVNDADEINKALEDLVAKPKLSSQPQQQVDKVLMSGGGITHNPDSFLGKVSSVSTAAALKEMNTHDEPPSVSAAPAPEPVASSTSFTSIVNGAPSTTPSQPPHVPVNTSHDSSDMSRNQLKVKIKGPFLDANYSSNPASTNSLAPTSSGPGHHPHHHLGGYPVVGGPAMNSLGVSGPVYPPAPSHFAPHHQWMMNSGASGGGSADNNPSNLRRMRKKELLRKYWNEDMNMDGGTPSQNPSNFPMGGPTPSHHHHYDRDHDRMSGYMGHHGPPHHPHHPLGRSVITIPKAVASMSILPSTQDDHDPTGGDGGLDPNDPLGFGDPSSWKDGLGGLGKDLKPQTQKKRRSRGIYREMAALGILPPGEQPRNERRRDRQGQGGASGTQSPSGSVDSNSRKRVRGSNKPSRSTFIPPTLAEGSDSPAAEVGKSAANTVKPSSAGMSAVVNVVNHPTPKLKIKFGEQKSAAAAAVSNSANANHLSDSDKETPNKKAKGRPPKKRGLPDNASGSGTATSSNGAAGGSASSSATANQLELLKRESLKFREKIMQDFAKADQQEILKLSGTRRSKKHKRKGGAAAGAGGSEEEETDTSSVRSKSPTEIKLIDGPKPKLIIRLGKKKGKRAREGESGTTSDNSCSSGRNSVAADKLSLNGLPVDSTTAKPSTTITEEPKAEGGKEGENDSGFTTGSGDGSSGSSVTERVEKPSSAAPPTQNNNNNNNNNDKAETKAEERNGAGAPPSKEVVVVELGVKNNGKNATSKKTEPDDKETPPSGDGGSADAAGKNKPYVPIRLKLSRCYDGGSYSLKNKEKAAAAAAAAAAAGGTLDGDQNPGAPPPAVEPQPPGQDSCQVR